MEVISKKLNISKRKIYLYFKNKNTLIKATCDKFRTEQNDINNTILLNSDNAIDAVAGFLTNGTRLLSEINPCYFADLKRLYPKIWRDTVKQSKINTYDLVLRLLTRGQQERIFMKSINIDIIARVIIEQLYMITDEAIYPPEGFFAAEVYKSILVSMIRGITTKKGLQLFEEYCYPEATMAL